MFFEMPGFEFETVGFSGALLPLPDDWEVGAAWETGYDVQATTKVLGLSVRSQVDVSVNNQIVGEEQVVVPATAPWSASVTTFTVEEGDRVLIHAEGEWRSGSWTGGADGDIPSGPQGGGYIMPDAYAYSLIGRIDDGEPFYIGSAYRGYAESSGTLYLGMNDVPGIYGDNSGVVSVKVGLVVPD